MRSIDDVRPLMRCSVVSAGHTVPVFARAAGGGDGTVLPRRGWLAHSRRPYDPA